jgi:hypothetical protein|tara:strand:+ start:2293 stop:2409 length:117 start_codon:yes stop_codon:yes gene_type:complete
MVSVALFMGAGMATVALVNPLFGGYGHDHTKHQDRRNT